MTMGFGPLTFRPKVNSGIGGTTPQQAESGIKCILMLVSMLYTIILYISLTFSSLSV